MKLLLAIVQDADAAKLQRALTENGFQSTKLASTGGFLREGNTTFIIGLEDPEVERAKRVVQVTCRERTKLVSSAPVMSDMVDAYGTVPVDVTVGGAIVFVVNVEEFVRL